jgi:hypothetical protein
MAPVVDEGASKDTWQNNADDQDAVPGSKMAGEITASRDDASRQKRIRDVNERGLQIGEPERFHNNVGEALGAAVGDLGEQLDSDNEPSLGISQTFVKLILFPVRVLGCPSPGRCYSLGSDLPLFRCEELGL